jgi:hypothetical protein
MSADEAHKKGEGAPVYVNLPGLAGASADPISTLAHVVKFSSPKGAK